MDMATNPFNGLYELSPEYPRGFNSSLSFITPFTHRTNISYAELLFELYKWLREKHLPELDAVLKAFKDQYNSDFQGVKNDIESTKQSWIDQFNLFMDNVVSELEALNDTAITNLINNPTTQTHLALVSLIQSQTLNESQITSLIEDLSLNELEAKTVIWSELMDDTQLNNRLYPKALAKIKAIYACAVEESVYNIFLGSSTTNGAFSSENMHYPAQITRKIGESIPLRSEPVMFMLSQASGFKQWAKPGLYMANGAVGGMTARNFYSSTEQGRVGTLLADSRGVVTMMIGSNDQFYGYTPENYKQNIMNAITDIKTRAQKGVAFILVHSFARADKPTYDYPWEDYRDVLFEIADADPENVYAIDIDKHYKMLDVMGVDTFGFASGDLVHNNEKSHTFTADWLGKYLELTPSGSRPVQGITMVDSFTDSNGVSAISHIPESWSEGSTYSRPNDSKWVFATGSSGFEIQNNNMASTGDSGLLYVDTNDTRHEIVAECIYGSPGTRGVFVLFNPDDNSRFSFYVSGFTVILSRTSSTGANTNIRVVPVSFTAEQNFSLGMRVDGRKIYCYFDGVLVIAYTMPENLYGLHLHQTCAGLRSTAPGEIYARAVITPLGG